jgi:hypothetical protein
MLLRTRNFLMGPNCTAFVRFGGPESRRFQNIFNLPVRLDFTIFKSKLRLAIFLKFHDVSNYFTSEFYVAKQHFHLLCLHQIPASSVQQILQFFNIFLSMLFRICFAQNTNSWSFESFKISKALPTSSTPNHNFVPRFSSDFEILPKLLNSLSVSRINWR